ncbi:hypothetical protein BDN70DRAFT_562080 [Pholiota conissans]|uniref:Uncharacterized protein n=1 Tax=Pholiota conissans TaxID=109636 RepID=A0A9P5YKL3_9AGAR|nr:hypothetical protein BDN70DRAFT_562080 [Pholiota conissans]
MGALTLEYSLLRSSRLHAHRRSTCLSRASSIHRRARSESPRIQSITSTTGSLQSIVCDTITTRFTRSLILPPTLWPPLDAPHINTRPHPSQTTHTRNAHALLPIQVRGRVRVCCICHRDAPSTSCALALAHIHVHPSPSLRIALSHASESDDNIQMHT